MASKRVTAKDWLDLMPLVADKGWAVAGGRLRDGDGRCPICALLYETHGTGSSELYWLAVREAFGERARGELEYAADDIARAADMPSDPLRPALLAALGLEGP